MHAKQRKFKQCEFVLAAFSYGMKTYPSLMLRHPQPSCKEYRVHTLPLSDLEFDSTKLQIKISEKESQIRSCLRVYLTNHSSFDKIVQDVHSLCLSWVRGYPSNDGFIVHFDHCSRVIGAASVSILQIIAPPIRHTFTMSLHP